MTILYINDEHCFSVEQLKQYFKETTSYDSPVGMELLEYGRAGEIAEWLYEKGETELAESVSRINDTLGDSEYFSQLIAVFTGKRVENEKPDFLKVFHVEGVSSDKNDEGIVICVKLKVISPVNESYELAIHTNWGKKGVLVNPYSYDEGAIIKHEFKFRKRPNCEIDDFKLQVDGKIIKKDYCLGLKEIVFSVGDCCFKMMRIVCKNCKVDNEISEKQSIVNGYYIGQTPVTQRLWKAVMGDDDESVRNLEYMDFSFLNRPKGKRNDDDKPMIGVSYENCLKFVKKLNSITGKHFRLPTDREWMFAATGAMNEEASWSRDDKLKNAWVADNSGNSLHGVAQKTPNQFGLYDMFGNVWERVLDRAILRGGSYTTYSHELTRPIDEDGDITTTGFRLLLVTDSIKDIDENFVDLGLSVLWARNRMNSFNGEAKELPTKEMAEELLAKCTVQRMDHDVFKIHGSNGNYIYVSGSWLLLSGDEYGNRKTALSFRYRGMNTVYLKKIRGFLQIKKK